MRCENNVDEMKMKSSKQIFEKVLSYTVRIDDISHVTQSKILGKYRATEKQYRGAINCMEKSISIVYKQKPREANIGPYNIVILKLLKSNMNIQFVASVYAMFTFSISYLCKPEETMSETMKKTSKEAYSKDVRGKINLIGSIFLTKLEVLTHDTIKKVLALSTRNWNIDVLYVPTGLKKIELKC